MTVGLVPQARTSEATLAIAVLAQLLCSVLEVARCSDGGRQAVTSVEVIIVKFLSHGVMEVLYICPFAMRALP